MDIMNLRLPLPEVELRIAENRAKLDARLTALGHSLVGTAYFRDFIDMRESVENDLADAEIELTKKKERTAARQDTGWLKADIESYTRTYFDTYCRAIEIKDKRVTEFINERTISL